MPTRCGCSSPAAWTGKRATTAGRIGPEVVTRARGDERNPARPPPAASTPSPGGTLQRSREAGAMILAASHRFCSRSRAASRRSSRTPYGGGAPEQKQLAVATIAGDSAAVTPPGLPPAPIRTRGSCSVIRPQSPWYIALDQLAAGAGPQAVEIIKAMLAKGAHLEPDPGHQRRRGDEAGRIVLEEGHRRRTRAEHWRLPALADIVMQHPVPDGRARWSTPAWDLRGWAMRALSAPSRPATTQICAHPRRGRRRGTADPGTTLPLVAAIERPQRGDDDLPRAAGRARGP